MIELAEEHLAEIRRILANHVPDCDVRVFGSRIEGKARDFSDIDLVLVGSEKLNWRRIERLKDAFASSDIPVTVDVVDWHAISDEFRAIIEKNYEVLQETKDSN
jgi:predicted nucleotidyltransferase